MAVNINTYKTTLEFILNKVQSGNAYTSAQFNVSANQAQLLISEKDYQTFLSTGEISEFLKTFLKTLTAQPSAQTGTLSFPSDFQHTSSIRSYYNANEYPATMVETDAWGDALISSLHPPTKRFAKYAEFGTEFRFAPKNIGTVFIDYFRTPVAPVWGFTIVNDEEVYDPNTSTNFEWDAFAMNNVISVHLQVLGVNLKDLDISQFAQMYTKETNSVL